DLKTPLTSVINYADLLSAELAIAPEGRDEDKLEECSDVLARQSVRLRKLIEDLIEASKAQTGNISVALAPLDASVLVAQAGGEWTERLNKQNIQLICTTSDEPLMINADGRQMGRIFDNILSNVSKYAMAGTRAYFSVQPSAEGGVEISCKNISATQLNISAEELLERFVRGDASRTTEGSGLGLSIAQSLMELQGGSLKLAIDADLFSVTLYFPRAATTADSSHALVASPAASASSTGSESRTE
ncbi:sensor histidine kinase, partial [Olegusella massiliensis]|uniref:sensor histidine kinase n=1 Tax=Olegusella massiliensis TaxID=1776381 RepID=UPI0023F9458F